MKLKIELSEEQLQLLINALEINFRFMMRQGNIVADILTQIPNKNKFEDNDAWNRAFEYYLTARDFAGKELDLLSNFMYKGTLPEDVHRLSDMWAVLRRLQYNLQPEKSDWDVRRLEPIQISDFELMKVEVLDAYSNAIEIVKEEGGISG